MRFHVLTLFPEMFEGPLSTGVVGRAVSSGMVKVTLVDFRQYSDDRRGTVDDYPFGGGPGMILKPEPVFAAVDDIKGAGEIDLSTPVVLLTPQGETFDQSVAGEFAELGSAVLICGRYEGVDERIRSHLVTRELSLGDYVLSGGEVAALAVIDAVSRLVPGVLGDPEAIEDDSHSTGLLQFPHYTRPASFRDMDVPQVLVSGDHARIARWRRKESLRRTLERRPDLLESANLGEDDLRMLDELAPEG